MVQTTPYALITSYSVESIFLGMNCVLYGFCAYVLWGQKFLSCRLLLIINTVQFLLCVVQVALHGIFLFLIFTIIPGDVRAYQPNGYILTATVIYNINVRSLTHTPLVHLLDWANLCVISSPLYIFTLDTILGTSGFTIGICARVPLMLTSFNIVNMLLWTLITVQNLCVAIPILVRLCVAQKRTHNILSHSLYKSIAIITVECGALATLCSLGMLILYACNFGYALASLGIATEAAVASQLLITARHAMLSQDRDTSSPSPSAPQIKFVRMESRHVDVPVTPKIIGSFAPPQNPQKDWQPLGNA
ncbi:hypothetical protein J3R83DRAFT_7878 [Lanmaoa asiatica]|nr:hypothetical protein J3R83DRAFT_7878 [Lanmaoa asiatica]